MKSYCKQLKLPFSFSVAVFFPFLVSPGPGWEKIIPHFYFCWNTSICDPHSEESGKAQLALIFLEVTFLHYVSPQKQGIPFHLHFSSKTSFSTNVLI